MFKSRVGHRLSATGLIWRVCYINTQLFKQLQRSNCRRRVKLINVARYKKANFHRLLLKNHAKVNHNFPKIASQKG
jgi:hypothetical protein